MSPERERLIKDHWRYRGWPVKHGNIFRVQIRQPANVDNNPRVWSDQPAYLEYRREFGTKDGQLWCRIQCDGVMVDEFPSPRRAGSTG